MPARNNPAILLLFCFASAFVVAFAYAVTAQLAVPPSDAAYGQHLFQDALVFDFMLMGALVAGTFAYPFSLWFLRGVDLVRSACMMLPLVIGVVVIPTMVRINIALIAAPIATVGAMVFCSRRYAVDGPHQNDDDA